MTALVVGLGIFVAAYYVAYAYGMGFTAAKASPLWIPDSILLCALLRSPKRYWWLFLLAPLPIRLFTHLPPFHPLWFLLGTYGADCAKAIAAAAVLRRVLPDPIRVDSFRDLGWFGLVAVLLVPAAGAFAGAALRHALGNDYWQAWWQWFLGDALAQIVVTPGILYWVFRDVSALKRPSLARGVEIAALLVGLVASSHFAFHANGGMFQPLGTAQYLPVPFLFWAAIRFGMSGASIAVPVMALIFVHHVTVGTAAFAQFAAEHMALQNFLLLRSVPVYLFAVLVEHRNLVERRLREGEERFRMMANATAILIWMTRPDRLGTFFNQSYLAFTGQPLEALLGNGWMESVHPDDLPGCLERCGRAVEARRTFEVEYRIRRHDGQYRWILDFGVPRFDPGGEFCGYIGSAIDITDRRQVEESKLHLAHLQRLALIGELSATIAHEIRQPLGAIVLNAGTAEKLAGTPSPPMDEIKEIVADIKMSAYRAEEIIGRIRKFMRQRQPGMTTEMLDVNAVVTEAARLVSDDAHRRRIRIELSQPQGQLRVKGDRAQIMQVLLNLMLNAMEAMKTVEYRHLTVRTERSGEFVAVAVADRGAGISAEAMPRLFESFFTTRDDGMGLGLSIARSIVEMHGGRIWAENNAGGGATFHFTLPLAPPAGTAENPA